MEIKRPAMAGSMESSDCMITIRPRAEGICIELKSDVKAMFGESILTTVKSTICEMGVEAADVSVVDKGALDCVIRARVQCAVSRATQTNYDWTKEGVCNG